MKGAALTAVFVLAVAPSFACPDAAALFVCPTAGDGALVLCGADDTIDPGDMLRFNDGSGVQRDLPMAGMSFAHWWESNLVYRLQVSWRDEGRSYQLYAEEGETSTEAGLAVTEAGAEIARVQCAATPRIAIAFMRDNFACDLDNPYGRGACGRLPAGHPPGD